MFLFEVAAACILYVLIRIGQEEYYRFRRTHKEDTFNETR